MRKLLVLMSLLGVTFMLALTAAPVAAETFMVTLTSGRTFQTRYQPTLSATDDNKILLLTEFGNWIALPKDVVVSVESETESKGFGTVLDSQTIALGWVPNSAAAISSTEGEAELDPTTRLINYMREQNATPAPTIYNNDLVVEPSQSTGIPIGFTNRQTPPLGGTQGGLRNQR